MTVVDAGMGMRFGEVATYNAGYYDNQPGGGGNSRNEPRHQSGDFLTESAIFFTSGYGMSCILLCQQ